MTTENIQELERRIAYRLGIVRCSFTFDDESFKPLTDEALGDPSDCSSYTPSKLNVRLNDGPPPGDNRTQYKAPIASFAILDMPGCNGVCISFNNYIAEKFRGNGLNNILGQFRIELAKRLGYHVLIATSLKGNQAQRKTMAKLGWKDICGFTNTREIGGNAGLDVVLSMVDLDANKASALAMLSPIEEKKPVLDRTKELAQAIMGAIAPFLTEEKSG